MAGFGGRGGREADVRVGRTRRGAGKRGVRGVRWERRQETFLLGPDDQAWILQDARPGVLVTDAAFRPLHEQLVPGADSIRAVVVTDEDAPELSAEQLKRMAQAARLKRAARNKPVVSIRISPETLEKAKATGKGYTGFLSRLLDNAINDPELVSRSL